MKNITLLPKITTKTYSIGNQFMVDIVEMGNTYEIWYYHFDYRIKAFDIGVDKKDWSYDDILDYIQDTADTMVEYYKNEYMNK